MLTERGRDALNAESKRLTEDVGPPFSSFALVCGLRDG